LGPLLTNQDAASLEWKGRRITAQLKLHFPPGLHASIHTGKAFPEYGSVQPARFLMLRGRVRPPFVWRLQVNAAVTEASQNHHLERACVEPLRTLCVE